MAMNNSIARADGRMNHRKVLCFMMALHAKMIAAYRADWRDG
jgi:hypothetical protein